MPGPVSCPLRASNWRRKIIYRKPGHGYGLKYQVYNKPKTYFIHLQCKIIKFYFFLYGGE